MSLLSALTVAIGVTALFVAYRNIANKINGDKAAAIAPSRPYAFTQSGLTRKIDVYTVPTDSAETAYFVGSCKGLPRIRPCIVFVGDISIEPIRMTGPRIYATFKETKLMPHEKHVLEFGIFKTSWKISLKK